jgi:hypothetical protein
MKVWTTEITLNATAPRLHRQNSGFQALLVHASVIRQKIWGLPHLELPRLPQPELDFEEFGRRINRSKSNKTPVISAIAISVIQTIPNHSPLPPNHPSLIESVPPTDLPLRKTSPIAAMVNPRGC